MAEAIGVAASGIALAEVAGKIVTTSLAIKRLIDDVKELPETFRLLLDQIDVLTPVLVEASSDAATGSAAAPSPMDRALDAAAAQCSKALDQLRSLASELSDQIQKSRGLRRKVIAVKISLQKDAVVKHEKRLDKAVQLLLIAQQTYILTLQRQQPGLIVSQLIRAIEARRDVGGSPPVVAASTPIERRHSAEVVLRTGSRAKTPVKGFRTSLRTISIGARGLTGLVEIEWPSTRADPHGSQSEDDLEYSHCVTRLRMQMPAWLSSRLFESTINQTHWGWTHHFRTYNTFYGRGTPWDLAVAAIRRNDLMALKRLFQDRVLTPFDRWWPHRNADEYSEEFMLGVAIQHSAWSICNYLCLEDFDIMTMHFTRATPETEESLYQLIQFLRHDELDNAIRVNILSIASPSIQSLISMRRCLWSDDEFYAEANRFERVELAISMIFCEYNDMDQFCEILRVILSRNGFLSSRDVVGDTSLGRTQLWSLLSHLSALIAHCELWEHNHRLPGLKALVADIIPIAKHSHEADTLQDGMRQSLDDTLLSFMFFIGNFQIAGQTAPFTSAEVALQTWLEILEAAGVDLQRYGDREVPAVNSRLRKHAIFNHRGRKRATVPNRPAYLCCLQYGPTPADWKLWWTEPSDEFVGEFWATIEYEVPRLPGSWVDDEDTDCET